jgi:hypothetical protein
MSKDVVTTQGPQMTSQYGAYALRAGLDMHVCACTRRRVRVPTCTHARTRKHAHTDQYVILLPFSEQQWFRERASVLRYVCLVSIYSDKSNTIFLVSWVITWRVDKAGWWRFGQLHLHRLSEINMIIINDWIPNPDLRRWNLPRVLKLRQPTASRHCVKNPRTKKYYLDRSKSLKA